MEETVKHQFEQIFVKHYERLTNSRQSVGGLPFTLENIVCFILFGGRELDIEDIYGDVSERYSMETFLTDARDAGIETDEQVKKAVSDLVEKKFLHLQSDGKFYSYQATRETARLLNRVYPKMQGMSLLAYIGQTMQEVESGRTDVESALSRFDQTLQHHGAPLPKPKIPVIAPPQPKPFVAPKKMEESKLSSPKIIRDYVVTTPAKPKAEKPTTSQQLAVTPPAAPPPRPAPAEPDLKVFEPEVHEVHVEPADPVIAPKPETEEAPPAPAAEVSSTPAVPSEEASRQEEQEALDDEAIASKIAAFEKELALVCPICKTNVLKEEKTAAGKMFYSCASDKCNFISWGRPHHIVCARCKNPFMVEVEDANGQIILKCPRATCQHRQPLAPAPAAGVMKKVVRKRLVRRKA